MDSKVTDQFSTKKDHETLQNVVYFCLVVVSIGFLAIVISYLATSASSTQSLSNEVQQQNSKIDTLTTIDIQILQKIK